MIHCFTAPLMALLLGKCCLSILSLISLKKWKSESTKSKLYCECGRTAQLKLTMHFMAFKLVWGLTFSCCKRKCLLWNGSGSSNLQLSQRHDVADRVDGLGYRNPEESPICYAKRPTFLLTEGCILNFFFNDEFTSHHSTDCHFASSF